MRVMANLTGLALSQMPPLSPYDFLSVTPGLICEHKWRGYTLGQLRTQFGDVWLEVAKYTALMENAREGDAPTFVVTCIDGLVIYADVRKLNTRTIEIAQRANYRCENDADPCYKVPLTLFAVAGRTRPIKEER